MSELWESCQGTRHIRPLVLSATRVVGSQEQVATLALVDSIEEQQMLESLLETSKPPLPNATSRHHYLLTTPFRYPPLPYGSRFNTRLYNGLFYASLTEYTALAETAYYRFVFWDGMTTPPPGDRLTTEHSTFSVRVKCDLGVRLEKPPFQQHTGRISHPNNYQVSQSLGEAMRNAQVDAFTYISARDPDKGINLGCFNPSAIASKTPNNLVTWICVTHAEQVSFLKPHAQATHVQFPIEYFLIDGRLATPAC